MFYRGQLYELDFQILDDKQFRRSPPQFPIRFTVRHWYDEAGVHFNCDAGRLSGAMTQKIRRRKNFHGTKTGLNTSK